METHRIAQILGRRGGQMRARRLSPIRKRHIASLGGRARAESLRAARRIAANFQYLAALDELRPPSIPAARQGASPGRLPGIYPSGR